MKDFFGRYLYSIIKMFVNQFAIALFGLGLSMSTARVGNNVLTIVVSCFAVVFYLFLNYTMIWEIGAKDRISVDVGKKQYRPHTGFFMALVANIPNYLFALIFAVLYPVMNSGAVVGNIAGVAKVISVLLQGMYFGTITTVSIGGITLNNFWWTYFLITVPSLVTAWLAYFLGHRNFKFFSAITSKKPDGAIKK